jgi:lipid II:glycine glycyltransferase (peptidoglycan interpeptide bridge formation enzyme)
MHHFLLHLATDPREPFFLSRLPTSRYYHNIEETLKEFTLCNLSLSNHQPQKTQKQRHRNITRFTQQTSKVPAIKKKQTNGKMLKERNRPKPSLEQYPHHPKNSTSLPHHSILLTFGGGVERVLLSFWVMAVVGTNTARD